MNQTPMLLFFTGPHCELCNRAQEVIDFVKSHNELYESLNVVMHNIRDNHDHYHQYAVRIPVLKKVGSDCELSWPFGPDELLAFLE